MSVPSRRTPCISRWSNPCGGWSGAPTRRAAPPLPGSCSPFRRTACVKGKSCESDPRNQVKGGSLSTSSAWKCHHQVGAFPFRALRGLQCTAFSLLHRTYYTVLHTDRLTTRPSPDAAVQFSEGGGGVRSSGQAWSFHSVSSSSTPTSLGPGSEENHRTPSGSFSADSTLVRGSSASSQSLRSNGYSFVLQDKDRGAYDRGVSLDAKAFAAEAEEGYRRSWAALHSPPGGAVAEALPDEVDEETGEVRRVGRTLFTAPFGETVVPAAKRAFSYRNHDGEWAYQQEQALQARGDGAPLDEHALLNLRKERQLDTIISGSPDLPLLEKASLVARLLATDFYPNRLVLQRDNAEAVMVIWAHAAAELRAQRKLIKRKSRRMPSCVSPSSVSGVISPSNSTSVLEERRHALPDCTAEDGEWGAGRSSEHDNNSARGIGGVRMQVRTSPPSARNTSEAPLRYTIEKEGEMEREDAPYLNEMRQLYRYGKQHAVAPTAHMMELLMIALTTVPAPASSVFSSGEAEEEEEERSSLGGVPPRHSVTSSSSLPVASLPSGRITRRFVEQKLPSSFAFHLAQRVLLDCDRYLVLPTPTLVTAYIRVCSIHNAMHYAVAQLRHLMKGLNVAMDADMATALIQGLTLSGQVEEALAILARMQKVPVSIRLVHAAMETLLLSTDPLACFSVYHACMGSARPSAHRRQRRIGQLRPTAETFTLLLLACEQSGQWGGGRIRMISQEMKRFRVKGSTPCLNLLLKGLLKEERLQTAAALMARMQEKKVLVWPDLARGFSKLLES